MTAPPGVRRGNRPGDQRRRRRPTGRPGGHPGRVRMRPAFEDSQQALTLYFRALAGRGCELVPYEDDADLWQHPDTATTVRLPARVSYRGHRGVVPGRGHAPLPAPRARHVRARPGRAGAAVRPPPPGCRRLPTCRRWSGSPGCSAGPRSRSRCSQCWRTCGSMPLRCVCSPGLPPRTSGCGTHALADRPELAVLPPRAAVAEALVRFSLGASTVHGARRRCTVHCRRWSRSPGRLLNPRATVESHRRGRDPGLRGAGRAAERRRDPDRPAGRVRPILRPPDVDDPRLTLATDELRLEGDEALDVRLVPVRYRDVPGPRYAGQAASGMPLQEAILRMTVDTEQSQDADTDGFAERSLQAERGGVDVTATERPPEPLPHDHGPDLDDHHEHAHGHLHPRGRDEFVYPEWDHRAGRYLRRLVPGPGCGSPKPVRSDRRHRRALSRHGHLLPGTGLPAGAGPAGRPDAGAAPAVRGRPRPGRLRGRDRRPAHRGAALAARRTRRCGKSAGTSRSRWRSTSARPPPSGCRRTRAGRRGWSGSSTCSGTRSACWSRRWSGSATATGSTASPAAAGTTCGCRW